MPSSPPALVTRVERTLDFAAVAFVVAGMSIYVYAYVGMRQLASRRGSAPAPEMLMPHFDVYWQSSRWAVVVGAIGVAVGLVSAIARLVRRRRTG